MVLCIGHFLDGLWPWLNACGEDLVKSGPRQSSIKVLIFLHHKLYIII